MEGFRKKRAVSIVMFIAALCAATVSYGLEIYQIGPQQMGKNSAVNIQAQVDSGQATWRKVLGPDWITVDESTGLITGTTPDIGEGHYVRIKTVSNGDTDSMTFILMVGDQTVFTMDGTGTNPSTIAEAYNMMSAGDVLIIPDGTYVGTDNTINGNSSKMVQDGTSDDYTTLMAENPNSVNLQSIYHKGGEYIAYKGFELSEGFTVDGTERFGIRSNHIKIMLCSAFDGGFAVLYGAEYVLLEDCFAYGGHRWKFRVGSTDDDSRYVILRRCVARHDYTTASTPTAIFMQYGGTDIVFQNCMAVDQDTNDDNFSSAYDRYGAWETKNAPNVFVKDSMAIHVVDEYYYGDHSTSNVQFTNCVFWDIGTGGSASSPDTTFDNITIGDVNAQDTENTFTDRSNTDSVYFTDSIFYDVEGTGTESPPYRCKYILSLADESSNNLFYDYPGLTIGDPTDIITGTDPEIRHPIRIEPGSNADGYGIGATILYRRGVSGTLWGEIGYDDLTSEELWPWPNEDQIKEKMAAFNYNSGSISVTGARGFCASGWTLTSYIWNYLGYPTFVQNVGASPGNGKVTVTWSPNALNENIDHYLLYYSTTPSTYSGTGATEGDSPIDVGNVTGKTLTGLNNGTTYYFMVRAVDGDGDEGAASNEVSANPQSVGITGLSNGVLDGTATGYVNDSPYAASGTADALQDVSLYANGQTGTLLGTGSANAAGAWIIQDILFSSFQDGDGMEITAVSNGITSGPVTVTYDISPPASSVSITKTAYNGDNWSAADSIRGTAGDTGSAGINEVRLCISQDSDGNYWTGSGWAGSSDTWVTASGTTDWAYGLNAEELTDNVSYTVQSRAMDNAGNLQTAFGSDSFLFKTTPQDIPAIDDEYSMTDSSITLTGTCTSDTVAIYVNGSMDGVTYTPYDTVWTYSGTVTPGVNTFDVTAEDEAGNMSEAGSIAVASGTAHIITAGSGADGSISPSGYVMVGDGADKEFLMFPDPGYEVDDVQADDLSMGPVPFHTFENVVSDHTIDVTFKAFTYLDPAYVTEVVTDGIHMENTGGTVPSDLVLTTVFQDVAGALMTIEVHMDEGTVITLADGTSYTGTIDPPRQVSVTEEMSAAINALHPTASNAVAFSMGSAVEELLIDGGTIYVELCFGFPTDVADPVVYYPESDGSLTMAGVTGERNGTVCHQGGTILDREVNVPEAGSTAYTIGLLLDYMSTFVVVPNDSADSGDDAEVVSNSGGGGGCFISTSISGLE